MTERDWHKGDNLGGMLAYLNPRISERKFRLTECAFHRRWWHLLSDERSRKAVEVAERFADGTANKAELEAAYEDAGVAFSEILAAYPEGYVFNHIGGFYGGAVSAAQYVASSYYDVPELFAGRENPERFRNFANLEWAVTVAYPLGAADAESIGNRAMEREAAALAELLRELFGNPFRSLTLDPVWRVPAAVQLAQAAYDERLLPSGHLDRDRLAVLSDALEEAGCDESAILNHLRTPGVHVRGCWALDSILGRERINE